MEWVGTAAAMVLGLIFVVSGASKVVAADQWPADAARLGTPPSIAPVVPYVEVVLGAALVVGLLRTAASVLALLLLVAFTTLLVVNIRRGIRPPCACFGNLSARPIGWHTVARNVGFIALAVLSLL